MRLSSVLAIASIASQAAAEVKHGVIGYGIGMYRPWCCTACFDVLSPLYLNCTTFEEHGESGPGMKKRMADMGPMGMTSPECYASDNVWLETFGYCIKSNCDAEGVSASKQETCWQKNAAGGMTVPSLEEVQPSSAPTEEVPEDAEWLNVTSLANAEKWGIDRRMIDNFERTEEQHATFSIVTMVVPIAIPILAGLWVISTASQRSTLFTSIRSYLSLPALFGGRHSEPLPWNIGYVPNRGVSILITIYIILNIIFSCVRFHSVQPSAWYANRDDEIATYVGNRTGVLSFANMALAMLFSTRNNPLLFFSGWSQNTFIALHRWAARVAVLQAIIHSIAYTAKYVSYMDMNMFNEEAAKPYFWWGIIGTTAMGLMAGLSILPLRKWAYELFLVLHIALAILSLVGCWYHVELRFTKGWGYEVWLYLAFAFWAYDRLVRFGKLVFFSFLGGVSHGQVEPIPGTDNIVSLKLYPSRAWRAGPGQHSFVYFPGLGRFWENHPFTVAGWGVDRIGGASISETSSTDEKHSEKSPAISTKAISQPVYLDEFYVRFLFRVHTGTTARLYKGLASRPAATVLSEGPYGGHSPVKHSVLKHAEHVIVIAGGIGITFAAGFAQQFADDAKKQSGALMPQCQRFMLAWSVREPGLLDFVRRDMLPGAIDRAERGMEYRFWLTGQGIERSETATVGQRMNIADTLASSMVKGKKTVVLVCGPSGMADDVRREVVLCSKRGFDIDLMEESFTW